MSETRFHCAGCGIPVITAVAPSVYMRLLCDACKEETMSGITDDADAKLRDEADRSLRHQIDRLEPDVGGDDQVSTAISLKRIADALERLSPPLSPQVVKALHGKLGRH